MCVICTFLLFVFIIACEVETIPPPEFLDSVQNPFGLAAVADSASPSFVDIDNDGDFDAFIGDGNGDMIYFENSGTSTFPTFETPQTNPYGFGNMGVYISPAFVDLNNDSDFDVIMGTNDNTIHFLENTGSPTAPSFGTPQANPFGLTGQPFLPYPVFVDIDNDGDFDGFTGAQRLGTPVIQYFENTGTSTNPTFDLPLDNPFGLTTGEINAGIDLVDIDLDKDYDVFIVDNGGTMRFYENTGSKSNIELASPVSNPFGLSGLSSFIIPKFVDIDNDGDFDLFVGDYEGDTYFFQNTQY
jgi:hypothetical protein